MYADSKLQIYKGMIQYLMDSSNYTLKRIAVLSNSTVSRIKTIYRYNQLPDEFNEERQLVQLYQIILDLEKKNMTIKNLSSYQNRRQMFQ